MNDNLNQLKERYEEVCKHYGVSEELAKSIIKWLNNSDNFDKVSNVFKFIQIACDKKDNE